MKLLVCGFGYGHVELEDATTKVTGGKFSGMTQREVFNKIIADGYGNNIPAVFHTEFKNGEILHVGSKDPAAPTIIDRPDVDQVWIIAPMAGG